MKLKEIMTQDVEVIHPDDSLQTAAQKMRERDTGFLPVCDGDRLVGSVTDRDIIVRAMAEGIDPHGMIGQDLMTSPIVYCFDDQEIQEATSLMEANQIRRLPILNRKKRLVGIVSLGDLAVHTGQSERTGETLKEVSRPAVPRRGKKT